MAFHVRAKATDTLVRQYAAGEGIGVTEAVHRAVETALRVKQDSAAEKMRKMQAIIDEIASWPKTGLKADKAFFDEMSGD